MPSLPADPQYLKAHLTSPSNAHTYRLLIFKDPVRLSRRTRYLRVPPQPASLHSQHRSEIMWSLFHFVNNNF